MMYFVEKNFQLAIVGCANSTVQVTLVLTFSATTSHNKWKKKATGLIWW